MHLQAVWHEFAAQQGNVPGAHQGDVIVTFTQPIGGVDEVTVPSNDVTIAAEAGGIIGIQVVLPDGRRLFAMSGGVAGIVDAPLENEGKRDSGRPATGGVRPEEGAGVFGQDKPDVERGREEHAADVASGDAEPHETEAGRGVRAGAPAAGNQGTDRRHDAARSAAAGEDKDDEGESSDEAGKGAEDKPASRRRPGQ